MEKYECLTYLYVFGKAGMKYTEIDKALNQFGKNKDENLSLL